MRHCTHARCAHVFQLVEFVYPRELLHGALVLQESLYGDRLLCRNVGDCNV
jgi:hypothetical protein